jgi:hypothetical protein
MLSEITSAYLSTLTYRPNAERWVSLSPLRGIYWEDEIPDFSHLREIPEYDFNQILRLFFIRSRRWKNEPLAEDDERFWDETRTQAPGWAFFRRKTISADDLAAQDRVERAAAEVWEVLFAGADELRTSEKDGVRTTYATFKLTKEPLAAEKRPWWERVFHRKR